MAAAALTRDEHRRAAVLLRGVRLMLSEGMGAPWHAPIHSVAGTGAKAEASLSATVAGSPTVMETALARSATWQKMTGPAQAMATVARRTTRQDPPRSQRR